MRLIHFTWKDSSPPPDRFPHWWRHSWHSPGWRSRLWTDLDIGTFTARQSRRVQKLFRDYPCDIMRADAFRYLLLRELGGLYVDLDFVNLDNPDWLSRFQGFACADQGDGTLCNALMWASQPQDPFFNEIEEALVASASQGNPVCATGPRFLTAYATGRSYSRIPTRLVYPIPWDNHAELILARSLSQAELARRYPSAKAVHLWRASWFEQRPPPAHPFVE